MLPEVAEIWTLVRSFGDDYYGDRVVPIPRWLPDKGRVVVFPGGNGTLERTFPTGGIMVVCNDFDSRANYVEAESTGGYPWSASQPPDHLHKMLHAIGRPEVAKRTWFTNFALGLKITPTNQGISPGWSHAPFREMCAEVFLHTLTVMKPTLIVTLGAHVPDTYLHSVCTVPDKLKWSDRVHEITFRNAQTCRVISNVHPDRSWINDRHHRYLGLRGREAEHALLRNALEGL